MAKYCQNCGAELNEQQDICLKCGVRIKKENPVNTNPDAKSKYNPIWTISSVKKILKNVLIY